ncbi:MAG: TonB-dependent receptor [Sulfurimonas sp.]|nr:TonB-dependent receptor [Sulfurimonas sp.]
MKRIIPLSLIAVASLYAAEVELAPISVESTMLTEVSQKAQVSSDLAETLSTEIPSIDMIRRSGIANDVHIRGQKRDNITVEVDGTKIFGACPNRMDPPTSHILASQINEIEVTEGPYDVETFGTMSGGVRITTKKPSKELHGEVNMGFGSWNYTKIGATVSGGNDTIRVLISGSSEASDQYEDGDGNTMVEQAATGGDATKHYLPAYEDVSSYTKKSLMAKAFVTVTDDQELRLSYTQNKSDGVLYSNTPMDAVYDYSNIYSVEYDVKNLTDIYKNVNLQYYYSEVDHPMDNAYRKASLSPVNGVVTHHLSTSMQGLKLKNNFNIESYKLLVGLDGSKRIWDGAYSRTTGGGFDGLKSINNVSTRNTAIFTKLEKSYGDLSFTMGARYDSTDIDPSGTQESNSYSALNANLLTSYNLDKENKIFLGFGQASRVPDPRELYYKNKAGAKEVGTPDLDQTTNQEIDLGYEASYDMFSMKVKGFYSMLTDYIYFNTSAVGGVHQFTNIDATIYGAELTASVYATDDITIDMGVSYKRGEKDKALDLQDDKDLADITPLRGNLAVNYEYMNNSIVTAEVQASDKWSDFDEDNGEQELDAWTVVNLKVKHAINKNFDFTLGVNNLFDETYAVSNTYADLNLVAGGGDVLLLNEPGRYVYTNLAFKF